MDNQYSLSKQLLKVRTDSLKVKHHDRGWLLLILTKKAQAITKLKEAFGKSSTGAKWHYSYLYEVLSKNINQQYTC